MPPKKRAAEHDSDPRPSRSSRLSHDGDDLLSELPPSDVTPQKRPMDSDIDNCPTKIPRLSPEWPDPLPRSEPSPRSRQSEPPTMPPDNHPSPPCSAAPTSDGPQIPTYDDITFPTHLSDDTIQTRLLDELRFVDNEKAHYNVGLLPTHTRWGIVNGRSHTFDRYLCTSTKPTVVHIIGTVRFIQTKNDHLNVGVEPLALADTESARSIQNGKARPPRRTHRLPPTTIPSLTVSQLLVAPGKSSLVYASKFLNGDSFSEAYDATDLLLPWPDMQDYKIPFRRIHATDTVLLECLVRRYPPANAPYSSGWDKFSIAFELTCVARFAVGPSIPDYLPD